MNEWEKVSAKNHKTFDFFMTRHTRELQQHDFPEALRAEKFLSLRVMWLPDNEHLHNLQEKLNSGKIYFQFVCIEK